MATYTRPPRSDKEREAGRLRAHLAHSQRTPAEKLEKVWREMARPARPKPGSANASVPRKVALAQAHMAWSDSEECFRTYMAAHLLSGIFGEEYVVDHVIPLLSPLVCGLHTHHNLGVIRRPLNRLKSNTFWPDMWPMDWGTIELLEEYGQYSSN